MNTVNCPNCDKLMKALELAFEELGEHQCPEEYGLVLWPECEKCPKENEIRYNAQRDIDCWKRYLMEKVDADV